VLHDVDVDMITKLTSVESYTAARGSIPRIGNMKAAFGNEKLFFFRPICNRVLDIIHDTPYCNFANQLILRSSHL